MGDACDRNNVNTTPDGVDVACRAGDVTIPTTPQPPATTTQAPDKQTCCAAGPQPGCEVPACALRVCGDYEATCCTVEWTAVCATIAGVVAECGCATTTQAPPASTTAADSVTSTVEPPKTTTGDVVTTTADPKASSTTAPAGPSCCKAGPQKGCGVDACAQVVCGLYNLPDCCNTEWSDICATVAMAAPECMCT